MRGGGVWLLTILLPAQAIGQTSGDTTSATMRGALPQRFPVGETMVYDAKAFGVIKLGRASMEVLPPDTVRNETTWHFRFILDANLVGVYRMHDQFDSWVGADDFHSRRYIQQKHEGGRQWMDEYEIYPDSGIYWQNGVGQPHRRYGVLLLCPHGRPGARRQPCVQQLLSAGSQSSHRQSHCARYDRRSSGTVRHHRHPANHQRRHVRRKQRWPHVDHRR